MPQLRPLRHEGNAVGILPIYIFSSLFISGGTQLVNSVVFGFGVKQLNSVTHRAASARFRLHFPHSILQSVEWGSLCRTEDACRSSIKRISVHILIPCIDFSLFATFPLW